MESHLPPGFDLFPPYGRFGEVVGPLYLRSGPERSVTFGMRVESHHCGSHLMLHGGMLSALIDIAFAWTARQHYDAALSLVTTQLSVDLIGNAVTGDWIEVPVEMLRAGRRVAFLQARVTNGARLIARGSGQFQVTPKP